MPSALTLSADLALRVAPWDAPEPAAGELVVRPEYAGLCGSDVHVIETGAWVEYWPAVLGHEVVGIIEDAGDTGLRVGARVVVDSRLPCRDCDDCARSPRLCARLTWLGESRPGGFATSLTAPATSVVPVPDGLPPAVAVLAEPLAVAMSALDLLPAPVRTVLIQGYGPVGALLHGELIRRDPAIEVTVTEPLPLRAEIARAYDATVEAAPRPDGFDLVIDAAGYPGSVADALTRARRGGTLLLIALSGAPLGLASQDLVEKGVTVVGSIGFDDHHLPAALAALAAYPERFRGIVSDRVPLSGFDRFLRDGDHRRAMKVIVDCSR
jgi:threonine dehydrogenase-like Zn-dependent dehydrogenase